MDCRLLGALDQPLKNSPIKDVVARVAAYAGAYSCLFFYLGIGFAGYVTECVRENLQEKDTPKQGVQTRDDFVETPVCSMTFDESARCIFIVWKQYATSAQFRFAHECILRLLKKHGACKILGDDSALATIHPEDQLWLLRDWLPRASAAGLKFAASKSPVSDSARISVKSVQSNFPPDLIVRSFEDLHEAKHWLQRAS